MKSGWGCLRGWTTKRTFVISIVRLVRIRCESVDPVADTVCTRLPFRQYKGGTGELSCE